MAKLFATLLAIVIVLLLAVLPGESRNQTSITNINLRSSVNVTEVNLVTVFQRIRDVIKTDRTQNPGSNHKAKWEPVLQQIKQSLELGKAEHENDIGYGEYFDYALFEIYQMIAELNHDVPVTSRHEKDADPHWWKSSGSIERKAQLTNISVALLVIARIMY